jgi:hypothetical protein
MTPCEVIICSVIFLAALREGLWVRFRKGISGTPEFLRSDDPGNDAPDRRIGPSELGLMKEVVGLGSPGRILAP